MLLLLALAPESSKAQQPNTDSLRFGSTELMYRWLGGTQYEVILKIFHGNQGRYYLPDTIKACYTNLCTGNSKPFSMDRVIGQLPLYAGGTDTNNAMVVNGSCVTLGNWESVRELWYRGYVTLPVGCNDWRFSVTYKRMGSPMVPQPGPGKNNLAHGYAHAYIDAYLHQQGLLTAPIGNSSVFLSVKPDHRMRFTQPWAAGTPHYSVALGAIDPENDSLVFEIVPPRAPVPGDSCNSQDIPFSAPYFNLQTYPYNIGDSPIIYRSTFNSNIVYTGSPYFSFDPSTGAIETTIVRPQTGGVNGADVLNILIKEYRNGVLVGSTRRERPIAPLANVYLSPTVSIDPQTVGGATYQNGRVMGCAGRPLSFTVDATSPAGYPLNLNLDDNSFFATPGASFTYSLQNTDFVRGTFSWTPGPTDTGLRQLVLLVSDSCRLPHTFPDYPTTGRNHFSYALPVYIAPGTYILRDTAICSGDSVQLKAVGGTAFTWSVLPGGAPLSSLSCTTCKEPVARPSVTTSYMVSSNNASGCRSADTVTVQVVPAPVFTPVADLMLCAGTPALLNLGLQPPPAGIGQSVLWSPGTGLSDSTASATLATPQQSATYIAVITARDPSGGVCIRRDTVAIDVIGGAQIYTPDTAICLGQSIAVQAHSDPRRSWRWTPATALSSDTVLNPVITPTVPGTTVYTVRGAFPGCPDTVITRRISAEPQPQLRISFKDTTLCAKDTLRLSAGLSPAWSDYRYAWRSPGGSGLSSPGAAAPLLTAGPVSGFVALTVATPLAGCRAADSFYLTARPGPSLSLSPADTAVCPGQPVLLRAGGLDVEQVRWLPAATLSDTTGFAVRARPQQSTRYGVVGFNRYGCRDSAWASVAVQNVSIDLPDTIFVEAGGKTQLFPIAPSPVAGGYYWSPDRWISDPQADAPYVWPVQSTLYEVVVQLASGCTAAGQVFVKVSDPAQIPVPSAFAPAAEPGGWRIALLGGYTLKKLRVYNRWGNCLFETADAAKGWDGTYKGTPQPEGVYLYMLEGATPAGAPYRQSGTVHLVR